VSAAPVARGPVICVEVDPDTGEWTDLRAITKADLANYVTTQPDIALAREVLGEAYYRLTNDAFPPRVVREIANEIDGLERWLASSEPHVNTARRRPDSAAA
jgi:hypothetical protein